MGTGYVHALSAAGLRLVGHEVKHILDDGFGATLYRPVDVMTAKQRKEYAADYFAACLLMPQIWVERYWKQNNQALKRWLRGLLCRQPACG